MNTIDTHDQLRTILIDYGNEEYGDAIIDDICKLFDFPTTTEDNIVREYDQVEVPDPNDSDIHNHSFVGTVIDIVDCIATVEDGDGDCFDIEVWRLNKV